MRGSLVAFAGPDRIAGTSEVEMPETPFEKRFEVLCEIVRAQHFAWRTAVREICPDVDPADVVERMWKVTGHETARAYLKRLDASLPIAPQVARSIAWSSKCMGEDVVVELGEGPAAGREGTEEGPSNAAFVRHVDCPWFHWHKRLDLLTEDRPGCDVWFRTVVDDINEALGTNLRVETLQALPDGDPCCLRRLWEQPQPETR